MGLIKMKSKTTDAASRRVYHEKGVGWTPHYLVFLDIASDHSVRSDSTGLAIAVLAD